MDKVIVVTVTFNSSDFLERLVKSVTAQTYQVEKIVCVDNASNDSHKEKINKLKNEYSILEIVESKQNLGGAGGFQKAFEYTLKNYKNFDWLWVMDDDAFPAYNCLENLMKYKNLENIGCLCPCIFGNELKKFQMYHHKFLSKYLDNDIQVSDSRDNLKDYTKIEANAFVGPLIKKEVIDDIGIPNGSLFIYGDDTEYTYRITRKYSMYLIKDSVINHRDVVNKDDGFNPRGMWKEYYQYRNRLLLINQYLIGKEKNKAYRLVKKQMFRIIIATLIKRKYRKFRIIKIKLITKAFNDGKNNISGKTIDPQKFFKEIDQIV